MKNVILYFATSSLLLFSTSYAKDAPSKKNSTKKPVIVSKKSDKKRSVSSEWCIGVNLPDIQIVDELSQLKNKFDARTKLELNQFLWHLALQERPSKLVVPLLQYLSNTEATSKLNGMYGAIALAMNIKEPLFLEIQKWPNVTAPIRPQADLKQFCEMYLKANEG